MMYVEAFILFVNDSFIVKDCGTMYFLEKRQNRGTKKTQEKTQKTI